MHGIQSLSKLKLDKGAGGRKICTLVMLENLPKNAKT
jgi:hypothetical protein